MQWLGTEAYDYLSIFFVSHTLQQAVLLSTVEISD